MLSFEVIVTNPGVAIQLTLIEFFGKILFFDLLIPSSLIYLSVFNTKTSLCISGIVINGMPSGAYFSFILLLGFFPVIMLLEACSAIVFFVHFNGSFRFFRYWFSL